MSASNFLPAEPMKTPARLVLATSLLIPFAAASQSLFKCVDAKGKITYQEAACPTDKDQKKVDTSHAGKTDWERAGEEKMKRLARDAEAEAAYQEKLERRAREERDEKRKKDEEARRKKLLEEGGDADAPPPPKAKK